MGTAKAATANAPAILLVAAEAREFSGLLKRAQFVREIESPAAFSREVTLRGRRLILIANGPGPRVVRQALAGGPPSHWAVEKIISTGFCGALDQSLRIGDIVVSGEPFRSSATSYKVGEVWSVDRVAVSSGEKRRIRQRTGASVVEMEYAAVLATAGEWGLPCHAIRVVSDTAGEDLPLDLNRFRDVDGRFQLPRIALAGMASPFKVLPGLLRLDRNSREAAEKLGEFLANCEF